MYLYNVVQQPRRQGERSLYCTNGGRRALCGAEVSFHFFSDGCTQYGEVSPQDTPASVEFLSFFSFPRRGGGAQSRPVASCLYLLS